MFTLHSRLISLPRRNCGNWHDQNALTQIARSHPDSLVLLSGGEPTLHRHFLELLDFGLQLGLTITINTNGVTSFFNEATLKDLAQHARLSIQVSLDGDEAMHDAIRGPDSYRKAVRTLRKLVEHGIRCSVSTTVVDVDFMARADTFIASLDTLGLAHIAIKRATYAGRAVSGIDVDGKKWNEHVYRLRAMPTKTRLKMTPMYDFDRLDALSDDMLATLELPRRQRIVGQARRKSISIPMETCARALASRIGQWEICTFQISTQFLPGRRLFRSSIPLATRVAISVCVVAVAWEAVIKLQENRSARSALPQGCQYDRAARKNPAFSAPLTRREARWNVFAGMLLGSKNLYKLGNHI